MRRHVLVVVAALAGLAIATRLVLSATADAGDPFDSPLYPWTWLVLPLAAAVASAWGSDAVTPVWSTLALVGHLRRRASDHPAQAPHRRRR